MAYTGQFEIKEDVICIKITAYNRRELEGTTIERRIDLLDSHQLNLCMKGKDGKMSAVIYWKKTTSL